MIRVHQGATGEVIACACEDALALAWPVPSDRGLGFGSVIRVREDEAAVVSRWGEPCLTLGPGVYRLVEEETGGAGRDTGKMPVLLGVVYVTTAELREIPWGTPAPIRVDEGGAIRKIRVHGRLWGRIVEPATFVRQIAGTDGGGSAEEQADLLRAAVISGLAACLREHGVEAFPVSGEVEASGPLFDTVREALARTGIRLERLTVGERLG